jgi:hypothetical protein
VPDEKALKADGRSIARIGFDPEQFSKLLPDQQRQFAYHLLRLFRGEGTVASEWEYVGLKVDLRPWKQD